MNLNEFTRFAWQAALIASVLILSIATNLRADDTGLTAHWKLSGDVRDDAGNHHGHSRHVHLGTDAATFDGQDSVIEIADRPSLQFGSGPFSIAMWVHTAEQLDDELGDLASKYDQQTRTGFNFSIQNNAGVTSSQANHRHIHFGIDAGKNDSQWTDHGRLGNAVLIYGMAVYKGQLFAGTCEAGEDQSGHVFRFDGKTWTDCGSPDRCNTVSSLAVYDGKLYVGVSKYRLAGSSLTESQNPHRGGTVYRYDGDNRWVNCGTLPETQAINGMVVYRGKLYTSSMYSPAGFFRYEGGKTWSSLGTPGKRVESLTVHNGHIYATSYDEGAVYRFDGKVWEHLGKIEGATQTYGFATHNGELYVSEWPHAKVYRYGGGKNWIVSGRLGEELESMPLMVYNGKMYGGTLPLAEVYRFDDPTWTKITRLDMTPKVRYRRAWTMAVYRGRLFVGTVPSGRVHSEEIGRNVTYDHALPAGWVHLVAVRATDHLRLYLNGKFVARSSTFTADDYDISNTKPLKIGFGAHDHFNGKLRNVRLYRRALTDAEIAKLAEHG